MNFLKRFSVISKLKTREKLKEIRVEKFNVSNRSVHSSSNKSKRFDTPCFRSKKRGILSSEQCAFRTVCPLVQNRITLPPKKEKKKKKQEEDPSYIYIQLGKSPFPTDFPIEFPHPHISIANKTFFSRGRSWTFGHSNRYGRGNL